MKLKHVIFSLSLVTLNSLALAASTPTAYLNSISTMESINLTLKVQKAKNIKNVKFIGLNDFQVISREIFIISSSTNESNNIFSNQLALAPTKTGTTTVYATADLDGKRVTTNKISLNITQKQLVSFKQRQKQQLQSDNKLAQDIQKQINQQLKIQQKFFENLNDAMQKQREEILKSEQKLTKRIESSF